MITTSFLHIGVTCKYPQKFEDFYKKYFGFKRVKSIRLEGEKEIVFIKDENGFCFELFSMDEERPFPHAGGDGCHYPGWRHIAFNVNSINDKLCEMGEDAIITQGPILLDRYIPGWKAVWIKDPEGNIIELAEGYKD
ncbi:MAG: VOC family protein [Salinivirgaceae bacterium]|nr:VOC family protein [Salinivirgaceae bacterium]